jgi:hypothetical protein
MMRSNWLIGAVTIFTIGVAMAQDAQDNLTADNWEDAAKQLRCEAVAKNSDGSWTVRGALVVNGEKISRITGERAAELAKRCPVPCPKTLATSGSGC